MSILLKHTKSFIAIFGLYLVISFLIYHFFFAPRPTEAACDFTPILIFPTVVVGIVLSIIFLVKACQYTNAVRNEYLLFAAVTAFPIIAVAVLILI
jgi:hypothetical protein